MPTEEIHILIDNGTSSIKAGLSIANNPYIIPTCIGYPKYKKIMGYFNMSEYHGDKDIYFGYSALDKRAVLKINYPIEKGIVNNWDGLEMIYNHIFSEKLNVAPEEHKIIIAETSLNPKENREKISQIFFETYNVPGLYIANQAILALNSTGRSTGIVIDSGDSSTQIVPIYSNYCLSHAIDKIYLGGNDLPEYLSRLLHEINYRFNSSAEKEIIKSIKEEACYIAENYENENIISYNYELPDGNYVYLKEHRIKCPEALFNPRLIGLENNGIVEACYNSVQKCDIDIRKDLYYNIIISGGNTSFKGLKERFLIDMKKKVPISIDIKVRDTENKITSVWEGAKSISKLSEMESSWITKSEYEESGATIVHRKCF